jgi:hypothetical protein
MCTPGLGPVCTCPLVAGLCGSFGSISFLRPAIVAAGPAPQSNRPRSGRDNPPGSDRRPPLNSRFATRARRSGDFAQVERFHGFRRRIAAACRPHRCCVQSFASAARKGSRRIAIPGLWRRHMDDGRDQCANALAATLGDRGDGVVAAKPDDCGWRERATVSVRRTACFCCSRSGSTAHFINCHIQ